MRSPSSLPPRFAGGNLFIGLSMGAYWLSLDPLVFMHGFWAQFTTFLYTIMPLFLLTLVGLVLSARLDWDQPQTQTLWLFAIALYVATSLITLGFHMPENLRLHDALYTAEQAASARHVLAGRSYPAGDFLARHSAAGAACGVRTQCHLIGTPNHVQSRDPQPAVRHGAGYLRGDLPDLPAAWFKAQPFGTAVLPLLLLHAFRYMGLTLIVPGQIDPSIPMMRCR